MSHHLPIHFIYDGLPFDADAWLLEQICPDTVRHTSPDGKLRLEVTIRRFPGFPAKEILPVIECAGEEETGIIEEIRYTSYALATSGKSKSDARQAPKQS